MYVGNDEVHNASVVTSAMRVKPGGGCQCPALKLSSLLGRSDVMEERYLRADDGHRIFLRVWQAENPVATVHINHGMAEHSLRYGRFAEYLNGFGLTVYAQDHRGHGFTKEEDEKGWFAEKDGWKTICSDAWTVDKAITNDYPDLPHILFGHSMGSFVARTCLGEHSEAYAAVIICGTGASQGLVGRIGKRIAERHAARIGSRMPDQAMHRLAFGSFCRHFPGEGETAWLTKDTEEARKYEEDPLSGFVCSAQFYADLIEGSFTANSRKLASAIRKDIPMLIISGDEDPVGGYGKGVEKVCRLYRKAGLENVTLRLFKGDRHEILNETDRDDVMRTVSDFIMSVIREF